MARISGIDLPREKRIEIGLTYIYGIGLPTAQKILAQTGVDPNTRVKNLSEDDEKKLRDAIDGAVKVEGDLRREVSGHIKRLTDIGCYRGLLPFAGALAVLLLEKASRSAARLVAATFATVVACPSAVSARKPTPGRGKAPKRPSAPSGKRSLRYPKNRPELRRRGPADERRVCGNSSFLDWRQRRSFSPCLVVAAAAAAEARPAPPRRAPPEHPARIFTSRTTAWTASPCIPRRRTATPFLSGRLREARPR